jgi:hypothetical protein
MAASSSTTTPKNALFAGSDGGADHWATIATLIETCKLNEIDPLSYLTEMFSPGSSTVIPIAISTRYCRGPTESKTSEPWPENIAYAHLIDAQTTHPRDAHMARLTPRAKIHGHGDEYRRPAVFL